MINGIRLQDIGTAERAVYDLVAAGQIDALHAVLYRRQILTLARIGLIRKRDDGVYEPVLTRSGHPHGPRYAVSHSAGGTPHAARNTRAALVQ